MKKLLLALLCATMALGLAGCSSDDEGKDEKKEETKIESSNKEEEESKVEEPKVPEATMGQKNAFNSAKGYLEVTAFSYTSLIAQLQYEGYSVEDATYAVDKCGADWNQQAAKAAKGYLETGSFSRQGLIDQLVYEGYTAEQAEYGVTSVGY